MGLRSITSAGVRRIALALTAAQIFVGSILGGPGFAAENLDAVQRFVAARAPPSNPMALAAHLETEGHWSLANRAGERFTASGPVELKSGVAALTRAVTPETAAGARGGAAPSIEIFVSAATVFGQPKALAALPTSAALYVVVAGAARRMTLQPGLRIALSPTVTLEADGRAAFDDAAWHLTRPLEQARVRVLAIEADGPNLLAALPRLEAATGKPMIDPIAPAALPAALSRLRGQTAVVIGQITDDALVARGRNGGVTTVSVAALIAAADQADVSLLLLHATHPAQPGGRNWLWQTVAVPGLAAAPGTLGDALSMISGGGAANVTARLDGGAGRLLLQVRPTASEAGVLDLNRWSKVMGDWAQSLAGQTAVGLMTATLPSTARQQELDRRLIKGLPSLVQWGYVGLTLLGLLGATVAWQWWARAWPLEARADYPGAAGFYAAQAVRWMIFGLIFMPLVAPVSAVVHLSRLLNRTPDVK